MTEREGLEAQERAELIIPHRTHQHQVFVPDAVHALAVYAGFIGGDHAGLQRLGVEVLPDIVRPLMYAQEETYAVPRSVAEVAFMPPQGLAGQGIDLAPGRSAREHRHGQADTSAGRREERVLYTRWL